MQESLKWDIHNVFLAFREQYRGKKAVRYFKWLIKFLYYCLKNEVQGSCSKWRTLKTPFDFFSFRIRLQKQSWLFLSPRFPFSLYQCGGCWAFSVVGGIESAYAIKGNNLEELSVQQVIDCSYNNYGCSGGSTVSALSWLNQVWNFS